MTAVEIELTEQDVPKLEAFVERAFMAGLGALELANIELGVRLGLYDVLAGAGPVTAGRAGGRCRHPRALRHASGWSSRPSPASLEVDDPSKPAGERRFTLPNAHAAALLDPRQRGVHRAVREHGPVAREGARHHDDRVPPRHRRALRRVGAARPAGRLHAARLRASTSCRRGCPPSPTCRRSSRPVTPVRIAEVGCGEGIAAITIAKAYPNVHVDGWDLDDASIAAARKAASEAGVADRVRFEVRDCAAPGLSGDYDLVLAIEMLHDVPDPVGILRTMQRPRRRRRRGGRRRRACRGRVHARRRRDGAPLLRASARCTASP